jgi:enoyl-CoA hydratase
MRRIGEVKLETAGGATHAWLDSPQTRNALSPAMLEGLEAAITEASRARSRLLVLRGSGRVFCAGAQLDHVLACADDRGALETYVRRIADVNDALEAAPFATFAVIEGFALAGGCELALSCDVTLAHEEARIGDRHLELALLPGAGGSVRLPLALGSQRGRYLLLSGEMITGREAADWGLVTFAAAGDALDARAASLTARLASRSLEAVGVAKLMWRDARDRATGDAVVRERELFLDYFARSADAREGLRAFAEKRTPHFNQDGKS